MTPRCAASLSGSTSFPACPTRAPSCGFATGWKNRKLAEGILASANELLSSQGLMLKAGSAVDATLIAAPSSTKNKHGKRDPEMHSSIGVDADSGLMHTVRAAAVHVADVTEGNSLLHGEETVVFADVGYQGADRRLDAKAGVRWQVAMRPSKRKKLGKANSLTYALIDEIEKCRASIRAKVEHAFRLLKRQFGCVKVRYRGLEKNTLQLKTLFARFMPVDGSAPIDGSAGMSTSESSQTALNRAKRLKAT